MYAPTQAVQEKPFLVKNVAELKPYIVQYTDGAGKPCTKVVLHAPGGAEVYLVADKVRGENVVMNCTDWFKKGFLQAMESQKVESV